MSYNNSYVSTHKTDKVCTADGKCYNYNDVFVDEVDPGYSNTCGQTCYVACSCNTSNGWYSSCQGSDCFSVTDTRYAGKPNAASASRSLSDVGSISASGANSGISASAAAKSGLKTASAVGNYTATAASAAAATAGATSGISTMASGATTCYKKKTCSEGGYYDSVPADQKCSPKNYNGYSCYTSCSYKTCSDYGYNSSIPSGKTCTAVYPRSGLTCYKDCKDEIKYYSVTASFSYDSSCPESYVSAYNGISGFKVGTQYYSYHENSYTVSNVAKGTTYSWKPQVYSSASPAAYPSPSSFSGTVNSDVTLHATYNCKDESVEVDYYSESRQEYSSAIGQNDNNLYLVIKSDRPADKNYTVDYDGYARFNGGYIPGPYADSHDGACEGSMMNIHSCTLKQGETKVECLLYECPCQNLWWDGTLSPYW